MTTQYASKVRFALRAALVCVTAFGLSLSADQVAAIQLVAEAVLQFVVRGSDDTAS